MKSLGGGADGMSDKLYRPNRCSPTAGVGIGLWSALLCSHPLGSATLTCPVGGGSALSPSDKQVLLKAVNFWTGDNASGRVFTDALSPG